RYFGETYYAFDHKGWHFMVLNSIDVTAQKKYIGIIDEQQIQWIKDDLAKVGPNTPVAIITHIPFISTYNQRYSISNPSASAEPNGTLIYNRKEVLDLFENHHLKLVMQA